MPQVWRPSSPSSARRARGHARTGSASVTGSRTVRLGFCTLERNAGPIISAPLVGGTRRPDGDRPGRHGGPGAPAAIPAAPNDPVERVAADYLQALVKGDATAQRRLSTIEEPPAIRWFQKIHRDRSRNQTVKGSFAPLAGLHSRIESEFTYDPEIARFTPKNPLGAAGETLDAVQAAKEQAEKSGIYEKMASGDPNDIFDAAENFGKVFTQLAAGALAPKKILPTYKLLVDDARPPLPPDQKELAADVADSPKTWDSLLKRPFHTLKADGPFIFERADVNAEVADQLASLGDPPTVLRLSLVRFRLEGIDTGWRITAARRILPGADYESPSDRPPLSPASAPSPGTSPAPEPSPPRSLGNPTYPPDTR